MAVVVDTRIDRVIVHPGAAHVTRTGPVEVGARLEVRVAGLPAGLDDDSVQIAMTGPGRATDLRLIVEVVRSAQASAALDEVLAARRASAALAAERAVINSALEALSGLAPIGPDERARARPAWGQVVAARLALIELARVSAVELRAQLADLERRREAADLTLTAVEDRYARRSSSELPAGAITKTAVVMVEPDGAGGPCTLACSYRVDGASWAPTYVARLDDGAVRLELRAAIAQATGEDWRQVAIEVSTAAPGRRVELPELLALRIGRAQARPARAGWRPPPVGVDELYRDWDRAFGSLPAARPVTGLALTTPPAQSRSRPGPDDRKVVVIDLAAPDAAPPTAMPVAPSAAPRAPMKSMGAAPAAPVRTMMAAAPLGGAALSAKKSGMRSRDSYVEEGVAAAPAPALVDDGPLRARSEQLAFGLLVLAGPRQPGRGTLQRLGDDRRWATAPDVAQEMRRTADQAARRIDGLPLPSGLVLPTPGIYDYAFASDGRLDVPADGAWHQVALLARAAPVAIAHVVTPAVAAEVYRVATLTNPLDAPLLSGPVDVYERGELVITARLDETPPGGAVAIGLGVDPVVKSARNARYHEEVTGVLRGWLRLAHDVTVDVENLGPRPVTLEVRERVPVPSPQTDEIEVAIDRVTPMWEPWRPEPQPGTAPLRGGHRWQVALAPGERKTLRVEYAIKIAGKHELVGGNRREP